MIRILSLATFIAAFATTAHAQVTPTVPLADEAFAMKAFAEGTVEVAKSRLALERATDPDVKAFAGHMIKDHTESNAKIAELARAKGVALPKAIDPVHATAMARMAQMSGSDFDRAYMAGQICAHQDGVHLFGREAHKGEDLDLKAFAGKTLPTLEAHTKMAYEVAGETEEYKKFEKVHAFAKQVMGSK